MHALCPSITAWMLYLISVYIGIDDLGVFVPESLRTVNWQYLGTKL